MQQQVQLTPQQTLHMALAWLRNRDRGRTDLYWLANEVLSPPDSRIMTQHAHGCLVDHCQQFKGRIELLGKKGELRFKNGVPVISHSVARVPMQELEGSRDNILLVSRGHLKTTVHTVAHIIQWILNYPEVRILMCTSTDEKAQIIVGKIKQHFQFNPLFRFLYPELCPDAKKASDWGSKTEFTVPRKGRGGEATVMTAAVGKALASTHHDVIKCSDVVTENNIRTPGQIQDVIDFFGYLEPLRERFESKDGKPNPGWKDVEGTIYDFCLVGETRILMADWTHKPISQIREGDVVVGWTTPENGSRRRLVPSRVIATGKHEAKQVFRYVMESGRSVVCTESHRWWKGKGWNKGGEDLTEYAPLGLRENRLQSLRSLLVPTEIVNSRESGWLAGIYDGEGSFQKNPNNPSGSINISQTMHNPGVIEEIRQALTSLGYEYSEIWHRPRTEDHPLWEDRCCFHINGGWKARYKFLIETAPFRTKKIATSLFGQLKTTRDDLVACHDGGIQDVYWFQCETGNYIAEGYCSKNSDYYQKILDYNQTSPEPKPWKVTKRSCWTDVRKTLPLWPERFPAAELHRIENSPEVGPVLFASQYELEPVRAEDGLAAAEDIKFFPAHIIGELLPRYRLFTAIDLASPLPGATGDFGVIMTAGIDTDARIDVLSVNRGHFTNDQLIALIFATDAVYQGKTHFKIQKDHFAHSLEPLLRREMAKRGRYISFELTPISNRESKAAKIKGLQGFLRMGLIRFADNISHKQDLIREIVRWPKGGNDDMLDALSDLFRTAKGRVSSAMWPDAPKGFFGMPVADNKFLGFDPITCEQRWLYDQIEAAHGEYSPMTGAI